MQQNFLLIGGSVSSTDIARELAPFANNIYQSHRNGSFDLPASLLPDNGVRVDEIATFNRPSDKVDKAPLATADPIPAIVTLKSGKQLCDIHHVVLCTGYHISLPFLRHLHSDDTLPSNADSEVLVTDGNQYHNLHKDMFYIPNPTLVFVGVPYFTATFTLFEFQAMVAAKVLSGLATLPSQVEMKKEYRERLERKGVGKGFHSLREKEVEYVDELLAWVNRDLEERGLGVKRLKGHTNAWKIAKEEQIERIKSLLEGGSDLEKKLEILCW